MNVEYNFVYMWLPKKQLVFMDKGIFCSISELILIWKKKATNLNKWALQSVNCVSQHALFCRYLLFTFAPSPLSFLYSFSFSLFQPLQSDKDTASTDSQGSPDNVLNPELIWIQKTQKLKVGPFTPVHFIDFCHLAFSLIPSVFLCGCR